MVNTTNFANETTVPALLIMNDVIDPYAKNRVLLWRLAISYDQKDREALKQTYTKKVAKVLPPVKALRYAQIETRLDNMLRREVYGLIPLAQ